MEICTICGILGGGHTSWCSKTHKHYYKLSNSFFAKNNPEFYIFICQYCGVPYIVRKIKFHFHEKLVVVDERDPGCVEAWPECVDGEYDPQCCRFPKSCSAGFHGLRKV